MSRRSKMRRSLSKEFKQQTSKIKSKPVQSSLSSEETPFKKRSKAMNKLNKARANNLILSQDLEDAMGSELINCYKIRNIELADGRTEMLMLTGSCTCLIRCKDIPSDNSLSDPYILDNINYNQNTLLHYCSSEFTNKRELDKILQQLTSSINQSLPIEHHPVNTVNTAVTSASQPSTSSTHSIPNYTPSTPESPHIASVLEQVKNYDIIENIQSEKYIAFIDFEFTCGPGIYSGNTEIISVGLSVFSNDLTLVRTYYSTCRPLVNVNLTKYCTKITKLTQNDIRYSPDSNKVIGDILKILSMYNIKHIFTYGNADKPAVHSDLMVHIKKKKAHDKLALIEGMLIDIQGFIDDKLKISMSINLEELSTSLNFRNTHGIFHNALTDSLALAHVYKSIIDKTYLELDTFKKLRDTKNLGVKISRDKALANRLESVFKVAMCVNEILFYNDALLSADKSKLDWFIVTRREILSWFEQNSRCKVCSVHFDLSGNVLWLSRKSEKDIPTKFAYVQFKTIDMSKNDIDITKILSTLENV